MNIILFTVFRLCFQDMLVSAADTGRDYEHCLELQRRMGDNEDVRITITK